MPRHARSAPGGYVYHALNRAVAAALPKIRRLRGVRTRDGRGPGTSSDSALELLPDAQPLALRVVARARRPIDGFPALADAYAHAALACPLPHDGHGPSLSRSF